jgi:hypothetical protein
MACSCLSSAIFGTSDACIGAAVPSLVPVGVSQPCGGVTTTVVAAPYLISIPPTGVLVGSCVGAQLFAQSKLDYRVVRVVNPSSTFIPKPTRDTFEFRNAIGGVAGVV